MSACTVVFHVADWFSPLVGLRRRALQNTLLFQPVFFSQLQSRPKMNTCRLPGEQSKYYRVTRLLAGNLINCIIIRFKLQCKCVVTFTVALQTIQFNKNPCNCELHVMRVWEFLLEQADFAKIESDFNASGASCIATLVIMDLFSLQNFTEMSLM